MVLIYGVMASSVLTSSAQRSINLWTPQLYLVSTTLLLLLCNINGLVGDCPRLCECKWKSGKESVLCLNANLSMIPAKLDAGTQVLDLTSNEITNIQRNAFSQAGLINLQKIFIAKCRLKVIDRFAFRNLINLVELDLSYNVLTMVPSHVFESIPELRELKLNGNPIQRITNDAFISVPQLVRLELSDCRLGTIELRSFAGLETSLEWLKIDNNKLVDIRSATLTSLHNLHGLELAGNPWNCTCSLRPLREWMLTHNIPYGIPPVCRFPARLAGNSWDRIELDDFACVPVILASDSRAHGVEGRNVTMSCKVEGVPEPNVRWILRNKVIANLSGTTVLPATQGRKMYMVYLEKDASNLTILTADIQDAGIYTCAAENKAGRVEASVTLAVSRKPVENHLSTKVLVASIIVAALFVVSSSLVAVCICTVRRRRKIRRCNSQGRHDSYEKIEMNHKPRFPPGKSPKFEGNGDIIKPFTDNGISIVGPGRRNGGYRNVPSDDDGTGYEDNIDLGANTNHGHREPFKWKGACSSSKNQPNDHSGNGWSPDKFSAKASRVEEADLHIPRMLEFSRTDSTPDSVPSSVSGQYTTSLSTQIKTSPTLLVGFKPNLPQHILKKQILATGNGHNVGNVYTTESPASPSVLKPALTDDSRTTDSEYENDKKYPPDLLDISGTTPCNKTNDDKMNSSMSTAFCTLPRKRNGTNGRYFRTGSDSQSPLLPECSSRSGSSNFGDGSLTNCAGSRRFSIESYSNFPLSSYSGSRVAHGKRSTSFLNLVAINSNGTTKWNPSLPSSPIKEISTVTPSATPLLDFSTLPARSPIIATPSPSTSASASTYDYHAAQLERFLEEYRNLQEQLTKMKETCETIRKKETPRNTVGQSAKFADPLMYNAVMNPNGQTVIPEETNPKGILKNKTLLPGQPPDPPPYWLHRNAMLKRLHTPNTDDYFQS